MMWRFSKKKFMSLPIPQQHKKCCEVLRAAYEANQDVDRYFDLLNWMLLRLPPIKNAKAVADRFHWHLKQTGLGLKEHRLLPSITHFDRNEAEPALPISVYLDRIRSAHNIGSIIRTTEALRLGALYYSEDMAFADHKQVCDAAMGSQKWVQNHRAINLETLPRPIICLETSPQATSLHDFVFPDSFTLVVGNEEYGCSDDAISIADHIIAIPMHGRKNSLNVANAFAIAAAEIRRQLHSKFTRKD